MVSRMRAFRNDRFNTNYLIIVDLYYIEAVIYV